MYDFAWQQKSLSDVLFLRFPVRFLIEWIATVVPRVQTKSATRKTTSPNPHGEIEAFSS